MQGKLYYAITIGGHSDEIVLSETGKLRFCIDSRESNRLLIKGVVMLNNIDEILLQWRYYPKYISLDIKSMYYSVPMFEEDADRFRMLYREKREDDLMLYKHCHFVMGETGAQASTIKCVKKGSELECDSYLAAQKIWRKLDIQMTLHMWIFYKNCMQRNSSTSGGAQEV